MGKVFFLSLWSFVPDLWHRPQVAHSKETQQSSDGCRDGIALMAARTYSTTTDGDPSAVLTQFLEDDDYDIIGFFSFFFIIGIIDLKRFILRRKFPFYEKNKSVRSV